MNHISVRLLTCLSLSCHTGSRNLKSPSLADKNQSLCFCRCFYFRRGVEERPTDPLYQIEVPTLAWCHVTGSHSFSSLLGAFLASLWWNRTFKLLWDPIK